MQPRERADDLTAGAAALMWQPVPVKATLAPWAAMEQDAPERSEAPTAVTPGSTVG